MTDDWGNHVPCMGVTIDTLINDLKKQVKDKDREIAILKKGLVQAAKEIKELKADLARIAIELNGGG